MYKGWLIWLLIIIAPAAQAQLIPGSIIDYGYRGSAVTHRLASDSSVATKKWFVNRLAGLQVGATFFKGGSASFVSAPVGLQLNRRVSNHVWAFAAVSAAPTFLSFNGAGTLFGNKNQPGAIGSRAFALSSMAELGLMYVNDQKTFSISGSFGVQHSSYPMFPAVSQPARFSRPSAMY